MEMFNKDIANYFSDLYEKYNSNNMNNEVINYYIDIVEEVSGKNNSEIDGYKSMYEYISGQDINYNIDHNIASTLHEYLYSKVPFPEVGGRYRSHSVYIEQGNVELCPAHEIHNLLSIFDEEIGELHKISYVIKGNKNINYVLAYIDRCIKALCKLLYIHPFNNGNERVARGIINKLLMDAGIAPVFIKSEDRIFYASAIKKALIQRDYSDINNFYLSQSCETMNLLNMEFDNITL